MEGLVQEDLMLKQQWRVSGLHYHRTLEDWLKRQDRNQDKVLKLFKVCWSGPSLLMHSHLFLMASSSLLCVSDGILRRVYSQEALTLQALQQWAFPMHA